MSAGRDSAPDYVATPAMDARPGVLVLHAWWGLTPQMKGVCDRLAQAGFVVLAPDLFGGARAATVEEAERLSSRAESDSATIAATITRAAAALRAHPQVAGDAIGCLGFSFGAFWALWLAHQPASDIAATVLYYGTGWGNFSETRSAFLGHFAEHDDFEPASSINTLQERLRAAGKEATFHTYPGTGHWFAEEDRPEAFDVGAAALAWSRTIAFLQARLT